MRLLLAIHNAYTDSNSGAARSVRGIVEWLADAGHECRVLCSARYDANPPASLQQHLTAQGISFTRIRPPRAFLAHLRRRDARASARPVLRYEADGVPVTQVITRANHVREPSRTEYEQLVFHFDDIVAAFRPEIVLSYGAHPVVREFLRRARARGASTVLTVRNHGYTDKVFFEHADNVLMASPYLARLYRDQAARPGTGINSPIRWKEVLAPVEHRQFLTFVNPRLHKGLTLFARLADMLGRTRPDIPVLVVQSTTTAHALNRIPGIDFSRYPQIKAAPATEQPADYLALTRVLLVPSLFDEPFGRVAAEALINGIPALVSDRGALPETVGDAGTVLPVPVWLTELETRLPSEEEVRPWYDAVCRLWDEPSHYATCSERSRHEGATRFDEYRQRELYERYFLAAVKTPGLIDRAGWPAEGATPQ